MRKTLLWIIIAVLMLIPFTESAAQTPGLRFRDGCSPADLFAALRDTGIPVDGPGDDDDGGGGGGGSSPNYSLSAKKLTLIVGRSETLTVKNAKKKNVEWSSSNASVASVSAQGKVKAVKAGKAVITASVGGKKLTCKVTVKPRVYAKSIKLKAPSGPLLVRETQALTYTISPDPSKITEDYSITWSSSKPSVVTVDREGNITAVGEGKAKIKATLQIAKGKKKTATVTVKTESGRTRLTAWIRANGGIVRDGDNSVSLQDGVWTFTVQDLNSYFKDTTVMTVGQKMTGEAHIYTKVWGGYDGGVKFEGTAAVNYADLRRSLKYDWNVISGDKGYAEFNMDVLLSSMQVLFKDSLGIGWEDLGTSY